MLDLSKVQPLCLGWQLAEAASVGEAGPHELQYSPPVARAEGEGILQQSEGSGKGEKLFF